jgi:choline dehydrogenase
LEFDFVIVGAGSAGCVLANRLSADPSVSVAVIEAGGRDASPWIHVPVGYFKTIKDPALNWMYRTEADKGLNGRQLNWPRGKTLGGSSSINGLLYVRGQPQDYDRWRQMGNIGWGWDDLLPLFRRSESWEGVADELRGDRESCRSPARGNPGRLSMPGSRLPKRPALPSTPTTMAQARKVSAISS